MNRAKKAFMHVMGAKNVGRLEYILRPHLKTSYGGPFNGQLHRQKIYSDIIRSFPLKAIVETGTCRGTTTEFMSRSGLPVYTAEYDPRLFIFASLRFRKQNKVHLFLDDSRSFLKRLAVDQQVPKQYVFFYLDAHPFNSQDDLPLREEVGLVFDNWKFAVVMIDDFQVPGTDYYFCDYGPGRRFDLEYLKPVAKSLSAFFPSVSPEAESGRKSGCVILGQEPEIRFELSRMASLSKFRE
jgi:hypothetical protein